MHDLESWFFWFWVKNKRLSFLVLFLIFISWLFSLFTIPKESFPDIKFGIIAISTSYPWVSPQDMDNLITEKIEKEIKDIDGIKTITSTSSVGFASTMVELYNGVSVRDTMTDIKDKIDTINFPEDANDPMVQEISTMNETMFQALIYGSREKFDNFRLNVLGREIKNKLEGKGWIVSIDVGNGSMLSEVGLSSWDASDYDIKVLISKEKLEILWLSISEISNTIKAFNRNMPIGNYTIGDQNYDFRFQGEFASLEELQNLVIRDNGASKIQLKDIAFFEKTYNDESIKSLGFYENSGYNYISLTFNKKEGANVFKTSDDAKRLFEDLLSSDQNYAGLSYKYSSDMSKIIKDDYKNLWKTAIQTLVLVFVIILLFVGLRESLIASILLPLAFFITFVFLDSINYSLNFLTNFSLVLTLGIAIDTMIVIIEWASERQKIGYGRKKAVLLAIRDLRSPLISGTMTTLVAFLPMIFLPWVIGKFLSYIPITVFSTLLAALVLSLTLSSVLFATLTKKKDTYYQDEAMEKNFSDEEKKYLAEERKWKKRVLAQSQWKKARFLEGIWLFYLKHLKTFLRNPFKRILAIITPFILLIFSFIFLSPQIGFTLFPGSDEGMLTMTLEAKPWTDAEALRKYIPQVETFINKYEELDVFYVAISWNTININLNLTDSLERQDLGQRSIFDIEKLLTKDFKFFEAQWLKVMIETLKWWPETGSPVWIKLIADDNKKISTLREVAKDFEAFLQEQTGTKNISASSDDTPWQFIFRFDNDRLSFLGLTPLDIINEVYFYTNGIKAGAIKSLYEDNDIVLKIEEFDESLTPEAINNLILTTRVGKVRLWDVANYTFDTSLSSINREDGNVLISVTSDVETGYLPTDIQPWFLTFAENYNYPEGITFMESWENAENQDLIIATMKSFFIAIFLIFSILVFQFASYSQPVMILYTVVLALLWVNIGLFLTGNPYSMPFGIGFIALTWVVVNDAIILVDTVNRNMKKARWNNGGKLTKEDYIGVIAQSGKARLQPIIVTTLTTVIGVLPLALQDEFWAGLGFTIVFGLFVGSFMTLFIIPSIYYQLYSKRVIKRGE